MAETVKGMTNPCVDTDQKRDSTVRAQLRSQSAKYAELRHRDCIRSQCYLGRAGQKVNDVGSLKVCRTTVDANLTAGNFSACITIDVIKQAAHYRKQFLIDEDIFKEMRVLMHFFREADTNSA
ncbi:unnamed protein product [Didymodactylos carnosus]|uniref:Uncharacterized protein n=1 Tax=Didymodactylos carnosus TaxID=1234261 RepID=A0A814V425_9BILA|nr:unnamed protein product [Didymodactylos carnosus]CAF3949304.1 unnamed protein product [Didymodactylos carnosus]